MLKYYEVENFRSYKELTRFSLEKTNYQMLSATNVKNNILKGAMFVGANASGKSNAILPLKLLLELLFSESHNGLSSYHCLFSEKPRSFMRFCFEIDNTEIEYIITFRAFEKEVFTEKLIVDNKTVLDRDDKYAESLITEQKEYTDIPHDSVFLREIYFNTKFRSNSILQNWFTFLSNSLYYDLYRKKIISVNRADDININHYLETCGTEEINKFFSDYNFFQSIEYTNKSVGESVALQRSDDKKDVFLKRESIKEPIPFVLESIGNKNLLNLLPVIFHFKKNNGILLLDEFSSGFHNDLEELLIKYFMKNSDSSQILFVSHSTNLLSNSILRPDQLYSVEFDGSGSHIKRFSEEKPREAQNLEKMYLSGVFGGVPNYED